MSDAEEMLTIDALIQYQYGRWAGTPRPRIPNHVVEAAVAAYDPAGPKAFNRTSRPKALRPSCPGCGKVDRVRVNGYLRSGAIRWRCCRQGCWKIFSA